MRAAKPDNAFGTEEVLVWFSQPALRRQKAHLNAQDTDHVVAVTAAVRTAAVEMIGSVQDFPG
jgi:hypothetical protein